MELEIGGKVRELKYNFKFIRQMDKVYKIEQDGLSMSMGVSIAHNALNMMSVADLVNVIQAATEGSPSRTDVENAIEEYAEEHGDLESLFNEVQEGLGKSPLTKATIEKFEKLAQA